MEIVRKKLTPDDLSPPYLKYDPTNDVIQISGDGGATWQDAPQLDPRTTNQFAPLTTGDPACDAAVRMVAAIEEVVTALINAINGGAGFAALQGILMGWLAVFGFFFVLVALAALVIAIFVAIGYVALYAAFNAFDWNELACKIRCFVNTDGRLDDTSFQKVKDMITADYDSTQSTVLNAILDLTGFGALNAFAATRAEEGDCSGCDPCEWCYTWTASELATSGEFSHTSDETYSQFWASTFSADLIAVEFGWTWNSADGGAGSATAAWGSDGTSNLLQLNDPLSTAPEPFLWEGVNTVTGLQFGLTGATTTGGAVVAITYLLLRGTGTRPAWTGGTEC